MKLAFVGLGARCCEGIRLQLQILVPGSKDALQRHHDDLMGGVIFCTLWRWVDTDGCTIPVVVESGCKAGRSFSVPSFLQLAADGCATLAGVEGVGSCWKVGMSFNP